MIPLIPGNPGFVEQLLADRIGLDVASVGQGLIHTGVENRMKQLGIRRREDYERILSSAEDEFQALTEEVVIPESWFFRDDRPFATFRQYVKEGWVDQQHWRPVSVLCLPCASGEEPYSVAITLLELGLATQQFEVVAIDISERSIRRAAAGLYTSNAFRGMNPRFRTDYFTPVQTRFQLKSSVRSAVRFEQGNILDNELLKSHPGFDVVFCRNLLIYFDEQGRNRAFANLDRLSVAGGLLFLGHADRSDQNLTTRFVSYADSGSFAFQKLTKDGSQKTARSPAAPRPVAPRRTALAPSVLQPASIKDEPTRSQPISATLDTPTPAAPPPVNPAGSGLNRDEILTQAATLADQGRYEDANRLVRHLVGRCTLDAGAHFLLGIIQQAIGNRVEAEVELTKAIYLDPEHDEALIAMALLARRKGDMAAEAFYRRRADRVLGRKGRS